MTHEYEISGMTCTSCVSKVKSEILKLGDVLSADIQLGSPQAIITMSRHIATSTLQQAISKAGAYTITEKKESVAPAMDNSDESSEKKNQYFPIALIFGYISGTTLLIEIVSYSFSWIRWMTYFMAGFFLVFSFFKLMNLRGFAEGYSTYDIVAKKVKAWGFVYPFIELSFAILLLANFLPLAVNVAILIVMGVSSIGVIQSLLKKSRFQCACLGTIIKLPLSKVTLGEDLLMVLMSAIMIIMIA